MFGPRALLAICGTLLALMLGEFAARLTGPWLCIDTPGVFSEADPVLGWRQRPNLAGWAAHCGGKPIPATLVETDARGFLNPGRPLAKPPRTTRVLLLGGNVPQAIGVPWSQSMAGMLEDRADASAGNRLEVVNAAMESFALDQSLLLLRAEGARIQPDVVLAVVDALVETTAVSTKLIQLAGLRAPEKPYFDVVDGALTLLPTGPGEPSGERPAVVEDDLDASRLVRLLRHEPPSVGAPRRWLPFEPDMVVAREEEEARADRVLGAILAAMRSEATALGASFGVALVPPPRRPRFGELTPDIRLMDVLRAQGIPFVSLAMPFWGMAAHFPTDGYIPNTTRFNADGHFLASQLVWNFLQDARLLPPDVVAARPFGGRTPPIDPFPGAFLEWLRMQRTGWIARLVAVGLLGVCLTWMTAPLPSPIRDGALLAISLGAASLLLGPQPTAAALGFAVISYALLEIPVAWIRLPLLGMLAVALIAVPLAWLGRLPTEHAIVVRPFVAFAGAMGMLRWSRYAHDRSAGAPRASLLGYLVGLFYFPTFVTGPIQTVSALAEARTGALAPASYRALARHLGDAALGALGLTWGATKLLLAIAFLNLVTLDVLATKGTVVDRSRLWLWLVEMTVFFWAFFSGTSDIGAGLARMAGVQVPEQFRAPWRATRPSELWRRALATVTASIDDLLGGPTERRLGAAAAVAVRTIAAVLWWAWIMLALFGVFGVRWSACLSLGVVAFAFTLVWLALDRDAAPGGARRALGWAVTHGLVAASTAALIAFPRTPFGAVLGIGARLVGLR